MNKEKTISYESWLALKRLNEIQQKQLEKARKENEDLKSQIEILKKFSLIGELFNEKTNLYDKRRSAWWRI